MLWLQSVNGINLDFFFSLSLDENLVEAQIIFVRIYKLIFFRSFHDPGCLAFFTSVYKIFKRIQRNKITECWNDKIKYVRIFYFASMWHVRNALFGEGRGRKKKNNKNEEKHSSNISFTHKCLYIRASFVLCCCHIFLSLSLCLFFFHSIQWMFLTPEHHVKYV